MPPPRRAAPKALSPLKGVVPTVAADPDGSARRQSDPSELSRWLVSLGAQWQAPGQRPRAQMRDK